MSSKISQLTATTTLNDTDEFVLARSGANRKVDWSDMKSGLFSKVGNTVFVNSVYGNDGTGEVENPAKPFITITAALTAVAAYWDGVNAAIPSATNIITVSCQGLFAEDIELQDYVYININDSRISTLITDAGGAVNTVIYGNGKLIYDLPSNIIELSNASTVYVNVADITGEFVLNSASASLHVGDGTVYWVKKALTSGQVKTLNSAPITIVNAPGSGLAIEVISASAFLDYGSVAFDSLPIYLQTDNAATYQAATGSSFLAQTADKFVRLGINTGGASTQIVANENLEITSSADSVASGDSPVTVYIQYRLIKI